MADDEQAPTVTHSTRADIPKEFSLRDQADIMKSLCEFRRQFIEGGTRKRPMSEEEKTLQLYTLAVICAARDTIIRLYEEEKAAIARRKAREAAGDDF